MLRAYILSPLTIVNCDVIYIVQVISLQFDPHYLDSAKYVKVDKYGETAMYFIKTSPNIFGLPSEALTKVSYFGSILYSDTCRTTIYTFAI